MSYCDGDLEDGEDGEADEKWELAAVQLGEGAPNDGANGEPLSKVLSEPVPYDW